MSYIGNQPTQVAFLTDTFSGTGSATAFTMSVAPANSASVLVAISGVVQAPSTYSVSGTTLTFSSAPASGTGNISCRYLGIPASGVTNTAYRTVTEFTATSGQTTFTPPSYTAGFINVFRNGVLLGSADYTATNGTTVVLGTGATLNDLIAIESFQVSSVLNAIPATAGAVVSSYLAPSLTLTTPTIGQINSAASLTPPLFYDNAGNQIGTLCRAWVNFNSSAGSVATVNAAFNVSSITYTSTGTYTVNFTNAFVDANYSMSGIGSLADGTSGNTDIIIIGPSRATTTPFTTTSAAIQSTARTATNTTFFNAKVACLSFFR